MILGTTSNLNFIFGIFEVSDDCQLSMTSKSYFHMLPSAGNSIYKFPLTFCQKPKLWKKNLSKKKSN